MDKPFTDDELQHQRGQEAEAFMRFVQEGEQYFLKTLEKIEGEIKEQIFNLRPWQKEEFTVLKAKLECLYEPMKHVLIDIELGKSAYNRITGTIDTTEGIL